MRLVSYTIRAPCARVTWQPAGAVRSLRRLRSPRSFEFLRVLCAVRIRTLVHCTCSTGENAARSSSIQAASLRPTSSTHQASASLRLRAIPASMRVSRTCRCDMRNRVITGTLAVVNRRVVPPVVAPHDTTRPKRACASSAMRTRWALGVLTETLDSRLLGGRGFPGGGAFGEFDGFEDADDEDLVVVDGHLRSPDEELTGEPAREPRLDLGPLLGRSPLLGCRAPTAPCPAGPGTTPSPGAGAGVVLMFVKCHGVRLHDYL